MWLVLFVLLLILLLLHKRRVEGAVVAHAEKIKEREARRRGLISQDGQAHVAVSHIASQVEAGHVPGQAITAIGRGISSNSGDGFLLLFIDPWPFAWPAHRLLGRVDAGNALPLAAAATIGLFGACELTGSCMTI
jgi:hypothetical protein